MQLPEALIQQFRAVAIERIDRIEAAWAAVLATLDEIAATSIHRELHTLKGEAMMLGFSEVGAVCHKLEDMMEVARARGYAIDDDFDLAVSMALRFMAMLVRKKQGAKLGGIDLPGFIAQIDALLADLQTTDRRSPSLEHRPNAARGALPAVLRSRFGPIAVDLFIEYTLARGARRDRLRASWHNLRDQISIQRAIIGPGQLEKHRTGAVGLARELGKRVELVFDIDSVEATAEMLAAIDTAMLHLIRNAIDHGIEMPNRRSLLGKPETGTIRLRCGVRDERLELVIEDDGRGVCMDEVHARALSLGLITRECSDITTQWFDLLCQPGFSTRSEITDVSGRGVGLDAVRVGIIEAGGSFTATTTAGRGTSWTIVLPLAKASFAGHVFRVPGIPFPVAVDSTWQPEPTPVQAPVIDLAYKLGIAETRADASPCFFVRGGTTIGILAESTPMPGTARRMIAVPPPAPAEIANIDSVEGLLVHPDRLWR